MKCSKFYRKRFGVGTIFRVLGLGSFLFSLVCLVARVLHSSPTSGRGSTRDSKTSFHRNTGCPVVQSFSVTTTEYCYISGVDSSGPVNLNGIRPTPPCVSGVTEFSEVLLKSVTMTGSEVGVEGSDEEDRTVTKTTVGEVVKRVMVWI